MAKGKVNETHFYWTPYAVEEADERKMLNLCRIEPCENCGEACEAANPRQFGPYGSDETRVKRCQLLEGGLVELPNPYPENLLWSNDDGDEPEATDTLFCARAGCWECRGGRRSVAEKLAPASPTGCNCPLGDLKAALTQLQGEFEGIAAYCRRQDNANDQAGARSWDEAARLVSDLREKYA